MSKNSSLRNIATSPRACAIDLLIKCEKGAFANDIVPACLHRSTMSDPDKAIVTKIVYSSLRNQTRMDYALNKISKRPMDTLDAIARNALRAIATQCIDNFDMYAAVDETIKVLPYRLKGYVNAVARKIEPLHKKDRFFEDEPFSIRSGLDEWIIKEIKDAFVEDVNEVIDALNSPASVTFAFPGGTSFLTAQSGQVGFDRKGRTYLQKGSLIASSRILERGGNVSQRPEFIEGHVVVMDQGSQLVAQSVDAQVDDIILDVCAAPGGKSILMSRSAENIIACDISFSRLNKLEETCQRLHVDNINLVVSDGRALPLNEQTQFDRILIDAPCSGLGVLRRRPDARHRMSPVRVKELVELQKQIVHHVVHYVKPGGYLIFSVCTFTREETEGIDDFFAHDFPEFVPETIDFEHNDFVQRGRGYQLKPHREYDGMYVLKLRRGPLPLENV